MESDVFFLTPSATNMKDKKQHEHFDCMPSGIQNCLRITCQYSILSLRTALLWLSWTSAWLFLSTGNLWASNWNTLFYTQPPVSFFSHSLQAVQKVRLYPTTWTSLLRSFMTRYILYLVFMFLHNSWVTTSSLNLWFTRDLDWHWGLTCFTYSHTM